MKILLDMNLSPDLVTAFAAENIESIHWATVGDPRADDTEITSFAREKNYIVCTYDLDFGTILALTQAEGPSVVQIRSQDILSPLLITRVIGVFKTYETELAQGALVVIDETKERVRILPLRRS